MKLKWASLLLIALASMASNADAEQISDSTKPIAERFDDWSYRCAETNPPSNGSSKQCEVVQVAKIKQGDEDVSILTLAIARTAPSANKASDAALLMTALVPLNVFLPPGLAMEADAVKLFDGSYRNCNQAGCWVQQRLDLKMLTALQKGQAGTARLRLMNGQNVTIRFSLKGLTAALAKLKEQAASN